jgi:hypothetical protein
MTGKKLFFIAHLAQQTKPIDEQSNEFLPNNLADNSK